MQKRLFVPQESIPALLDGSKTQARKVVKRKGYEKELHEPGRNSAKHEFGNLWQIGYEVGRLRPANSIGVRCLYQPGDLIWVPEAWNVVPTTGHIDEPFARYVYKADKRLIDNIPWRSPVTMPMSAARIWLEVLGTRVERLQEITDVNALKEGCIGTVCKHLNRDEHGCTDCMNSGWIEPPRVEFFELWDSLNVKRGYGWDTNPWVWVISFKRIKP